MSSSQGSKSATAPTLSQTDGDQTTEQSSSYQLKSTNRVGQENVAIGENGQDNVATDGRIAQAARGDGVVGGVQLLEMFLMGSAASEAAKMVKQRMADKTV